MRSLKILVLAVFAASITNVNVCSDVLFQKNRSNSGNKHLVISNVANTAAIPLYLRHDQQGKKTIEYNSLHKICLFFSAKKRFLYFGSPDSFFASSSKINDYSLISLHCLITI